MPARLQLSQRPLHTVHLSLSLQHALHILHMGQTELTDYIRDACANNPFLEWDSSPVNSERHSMGVPLESMEQMTSLTDFLISQLQLIRVPIDVGRAIHFMIGSLNDSGYLVESDQEIANQLDVSHDVVAQALTTFQSFDPPGIGARNLKECLLLQLNSVTPIYQPLVQSLLQHHLDDVARNDWDYLSNILDVDIDHLLKAFKEIQKMQPRPSWGYRSPEKNDVIADVMVEQIEGTFIPVLNPLATPRPRLAPLDQDLVPKQDAQALEWYNTHIASGLHVLSLLEKRATTILKVAHVIVAAQMPFFEQGIPAMRPLTLHQVASMTNLHTSTISRTTQNKFMATPWGVYPFRFFFPSHVLSDSASVSSLAIKFMLKNFIANEDKHEPKSDEVLHQQFNEQGIHVARRTITKYREEMRILSSRQRKLRPSHPHHVNGHYL